MLAARRKQALEAKSLWVLPDLLSISLDLADLLVDGRSLSHPFHHRRRAACFRDPYPLRGTFDDAPRPHRPLRCPHRISRCCSHYLRVRSRWSQVEGAGCADGSGGRSVWRCNWHSFRCLGWCCADSARLVSAITLFAPGGCMLTVLPIRDREWQKWPVTIVCGAYAGYAAGKLLGGVVLRGKTFAFD